MPASQTARSFEPPLQADTSRPDSEEVCIDRICDTTMSEAKRTSAACWPPRKFASIRPVSTPMMEIETSSSTSVKPARSEREQRGIPSEHAVAEEQHDERGGAQEGAERHLT